MCIQEIAHDMYEQQVSARVMQAKECRSTLRPHLHAWHFVQD